MILVKEDIGEVALVCIFPEPERLIERIVKMRIENHLTDKRRIEHCCIDKEQ